MRSRFAWTAIGCFALTLGCADGATGEGAYQAPAVSGYPQVISPDSAELILSDSTVSCAACTLDTVRVTRFGSERDSLLMRKLPRVVVGSNRTIYATPIDAWGQEILVFNPDGTQRGQLGRHGAGPGEYQQIAGVGIDPGDSLLVAHDGARVTVFQPTGEYARTARTGIVGLRSIAAWSNGTLVIAGRSLTPDSGLPLHVLSPNGSAVRSFGSKARQLGGWEYRLIAIGPDGDVWKVEDSNLRLERADSTGRLIQVIGVHDRDFARPMMTEREVQQLDSALRALKAQGRVRDITPELAARPARPRFPPVEPKVSGIQVDTEGLVWVTLQLPSDDWRDVDITYKRDDDAIVDDHLRPPLQKTRILIIDPSRFELISTTTLKGLWQLAGNGMAVRLDYDDNGVIFGDLYRIGLRRR